MQYSPKLKKAMEEIRQILVKHDIAAFVALHTPGNSEYLNHVNPSYSCAKHEGDTIRIKAKASDYNGDTDKRNKFISDTANMFHCLSEVVAQNALSLTQLSIKLDEITSATHFGNGHSSHTQQNN